MNFHSEQSCISSMEFTFQPFCRIKNFEDKNLPKICPEDKNLPKRFSMTVGVCLKHPSLFSLKLKDAAYIGEMITRLYSPVIWCCFHTSLKQSHRFSSPCHTIQMRHHTILIKYHTILIKSHTVLMSSDIILMRFL